MKIFVNLQNSRYLQYVSALTAALSLSTAVAYVIWSSPSLLKLTSENSPIGTTLTPEEASWVASSAILGAVLGSLVAGLIADRVGRRRALLLAVPVVFIPWIVIAFTKSVLVLILVRFIGGIGNSIAFTTAPIYNSEIADKDIRGILVVCCNILMNAGSFFVLSVGPFVSYKVLALSCSAIPLIFFILFYFMPESPYYLVKIGEKDLAKNNLIRLARKNIKEDTINDSFKEIEKIVEADMKNKSTLWEFLSKKQYRSSLFIMIGIRIFQEFSGLAAIESYMQIIMESTKSSISSEVSSIIFGAMQILAVLNTTVLVDRIGRKPLYITSALGSAFFLTALGIYFYLQDVMQADIKNISWLPTTSLALYFLMNHTGLYSLSYVLFGEVFATNIKAVAIAASSTINGILIFLVIKLYEPMTSAWGIHTILWMYAGSCILGSLFIIFFLPETKGKSFAEIQSILRKNKNIQL